MPNQNTEQVTGTTRGEKIGIISLILAALVTIQFMFGFIIIKEGTAGIKMRGTVYVKEPMLPGYRFFIPFYDIVIVIPTKPIMLNYSKTKFNEKDTKLLKFDKVIESLDELGNVVKVAISFEAVAVLDQMPTMFAKDGTFDAGFFKKVEDPFRSVVRNTIAEFNANTMQKNRAAISNRLIARIQISFDKNEYFELVNNSVNLKELIPSDAVKKLQEEVSIAQQRTSVNKKKADSMRELANGKADAITIEANAQAKANKELANSITPELIDYIEATRWNGDRRHTVVNPGRDGVTPPIIIGGDK